MKTFLLCLLLAFGCSCQNTLPLPTRQISTNSDLDVVVALVSPRTHEAYCTGVVTPQGILTAAHCVPDSSAEVFVSQESDLASDLSPDEFPYFAHTSTVHVIRVDIVRDLALLANPFRSVVPVRMGSAAYTVGQPLVMVGHPIGAVFTVHYGEVSSVHRVLHKLVVRIGLVPGFSGGPVFDQNGLLVGLADGRLISMNSGREPEADIGLIVPIDEIVTFLRNG